MQNLLLDSPCHRAILAVDIEGSTTKTNPAKGQLRQAMYDLLDRALQAGGISERHRDPPIDRGDGALTLVHPVDQAPKTLLLSRVIPAFAALLLDHNRSQTGQQFRLRAAIHAGEVHYDSRGCFGESLDITFRLLDAPRVKATLRHSQAPLVLVISDEIYRSVVRHGYEGIDHRDFEPLIGPKVADQRLRGWLHIPEIEPTKGSGLAFQWFNDYRQPYAQTNNESSIRINGNEAPELRS